MSWEDLLSGASKLCWLLLLASVVACSAPQGPPSTAAGHGPQAVVARTDSAVPQPAAEQVSQYIRCLFQDRDGNLWFGSTTDGVVRYDGRTLDYFNARNGFGSDWVNAIAQDAAGDPWFATRDGVIRYDGTRFIRYTTKDGLASDHCWSLLIDRNGVLWVGTYQGVARFDGHRFLPWAIPEADLSAHPYYDDPKLIHSIVQDRAGDIWFGTKGGAYRYSGNRLTRFSGTNGLCNDFVNTILPVRDGRMLFGTRFNGLCAFNGNSLDTLMHAALQAENVGMLHEQRDGTLWVGLSAVGLCRYSGATLTRYNADSGEGIRVVFCMLEDDQGRLWIGTGAGLYRYEAERFVNVTKADLM